MDPTLGNMVSGPCHRWRVASTGLDFRLLGSTCSAGSQVDREMLCVVHGKLLLRDVSRGAIWRDLTGMLWWLWCLQTIKGHDFQVVYVAPGVQVCRAVPGPGLETRAATLGGVNQDSEQHTSPHSCFLSTKSSVLIQTTRQSLQPLNAQGNA